MYHPVNVSRVTFSKCVVICTHADDIRLWQFVVWLQIKTVDTELNIILQLVYLAFAYKTPRKYCMYIVNINKNKYFVHSLGLDVITLL